MKLPQVEYSREERARADKRSVLLEINKLAANYFIISFISLRGETVMSILRNGS